VGSLGTVDTLCSIRAVGAFFGAPRDGKRACGRLEHLPRVAAVRGRRIWQRTRPNRRIRPGCDLRPTSSPRVCWGLRWQAASRRSSRCRQPSLHGTFEVRERPLRVENNLRLRAAGAAPRLSWVEMRRCDDVTIAHLPAGSRAAETCKIVHGDGAERRLRRSWNPAGVTGEARRMHPEEKGGG
jgi:hypothetical protein